MKPLLFRLCCVTLLAIAMTPVTAQELAPATYAPLRAKIDVTAEELCWQKVAWLPFWDGLVAAQQQDRPIFYWIYFGDPRGGC